MASVMEKDVLIEMLAHVVAGIALSTGDKAELTKVANYREELYRTSPEELDFALWVERLKGYSTHENARSDFQATHPFTEAERAAIEAQIAHYDEQSDVEAKFPMIWDFITAGHEAKAGGERVAFVLGGQPGAGKAFATQTIKTEYPDAIVVNADEFRPFHAHYADFYRLYDEDASRYTGSFIAKLVARVRNRAMELGLPLVIEGTFRTASTPMTELTTLREQGYRVEILLCTRSVEESWAHTRERGDKLLSVGLPPRYVPREHFDSVIGALATNAQTVYASALASRFRIYGPDGILWDSVAPSENTPNAVIQRTLFPSSEA